MLNPITKTKTIISPLSDKNTSMQQLFTAQEYQWGEIKQEEEKQK